MHGKFVLHPVSGRRIPIICDAELVDMSFGTGAVKVGLSVTNRTYKMLEISVFHVHVGSMASVRGQGGALAHAGQGWHEV